MEVKLSSVYHGKGARSSYVYAVLVEASTGELIISATLDYVMAAVKERGYTLVA